MFVKVVDLKENIYTDQTVKFPYLSSKGMRYIMIVYHTDDNYIFFGPMCNITEYKMLKTYEKIIMWMKTEGSGTKKHALENELSK